MRWQRQRNFITLVGYVPTYGDSYGVGGGVSREGTKK